MPIKATVLTPGGPIVASLIAVYATCRRITVGAHAEWLGDYTISGQQQQVLTIAGVRWP